MNDEEILAAARKLMKTCPPEHSGWVCTIASAPNSCTMRISSAFAAKLCAGQSAVYFKIYGREKEKLCAYWDDAAVAQEIQTFVYSTLRALDDKKKATEIEEKECQRRIALAELDSFIQKEVKAAEDYIKAEKEALQCPT